MSQREDGFYWVRSHWQQYGKQQISEWQVMRWDGRAWWATGCELEYGPDEIYEVGERVTRND